MKDNFNFTDLFSHSPIRPLQEHMRTVLCCVEELPVLIDAMINEDRKRLNAFNSIIDKYEAEADTIKNLLRERLPKSLFMPIDRRDLLEILDFQDRIAGNAKDIGTLFTQRKFHLPKDMGEPLMELVNTCVKACRSALVAIEELDELVQMGFTGREVNTVISLIEQTVQIEGEAVQQATRLTKTLFSHESKLDCVTVILLYQAIQWIVDVADNAHSVANRMRLVIAR